jgi:hypothetical protein
MSWPGPESGWAPPPPSPPPAWGYYWAPPPENTVATVGMVCSIVGAGLLVLSFGLLWLVTLPLSIAGLVCGIVGKRKLARGEVTGSRGVATAAIVIGIVGIVLHVIVALLFVLFWAAIVDALDEVDSTPGHDLQPAFLALLTRV